jgi:hypothetical protein
MIVLAALFRRNFCAVSAVSPPVEAEPATKKVMVAIHTGHMEFSFSCWLFRFNHTTIRTPCSGQRFFRIQKPEFRSCRSSGVQELQNTMIRLASMKFRAESLTCESISRRIAKPLQQLLHSEFWLLNSKKSVVLNRGSCSSYD